jgi:neurofibromin 1
MLSTDSTVGGNVSPAPSKEKNRDGAVQWAQQDHPGSRSYCFGVRFIQQHSYPSSSDTSPDQPKILAHTAGSTTAAINGVAKYVSRIIFYLSSSNFPLIMGRVKARISYLTTTIEESPDLVELRLIEWANVDRNRLAQLIQEVSSTFLHIKRPAQVPVANVLRKAIRNWIDIHPDEYESLIESNRKIEGGVDVLFDVLHSASDLSSSNTRRAKAFYPLMAMLLVASPDTLKRAVIGDSGRSTGVAKKLQFLESLRKGLATNKGFEACAVCYVDFVRAAMSLSPRWESAGVKSLVPDIQNDLKVSSNCDLI